MDENMSWYLDENIEKFGSSETDQEHEDFQESNMMHGNSLFGESAEQILPYLFIWKAIESALIVTQILLYLRPGSGVSLYFFYIFISSFSFQL